MEQFRHVKSKINMDAPQARARDSSFDSAEGGHNSPTRAPKQFLKKGSMAARLNEARVAKASPRLTPRKELSKAAVPKASEVTKVAPRRKTDFVASNRTDAVNMEAKRAETEAEPARHSEFGAVPQYIIDRREQWAAEEKRRREAAPDPNCPPGMTVMSEQERIETLDILKESEKEAQELLHKLPLHATTQRMKKRKDALEAKLKEIEAAKKILSKKVVYVKA